MAQRVDFSANAPRYGRVAAALASRGCKVVALEPSATMLAKLREKPFGDAVACVCGEAGRLPFPPGFFDAVVVARLLYLTADWQQILRQAREALRPGGHLLHEWSNGHPMKVGCRFESASVV